VKEDPKTRAVTLRYRRTAHGQRKKAFDLVVLSVGFQSSKNNRALAERLGVSLSEDGFCATSALHPMETDRPGIYACGVFCGPMDIPDAVTMAGRCGGHGHGRPFWGDPAVP
jgi:heterodisulfide reductase subunit A